MTKIFDFHKPANVSDLNKLIKQHLSAKFEKRKAILFMKSDNVYQHFGIDDKIVLVKSLKHYSKKEGIQDVFWIYSKELT